MPINSITNETSLNRCNSCTVSSFGWGCFDCDFYFSSKLKGVKTMGNGSDEMRRWWGGFDPLEKLRVMNFRDSILNQFNEKTMFGKFKNSAFEVVNVTNNEFELVANYNVDVLVFTGRCGFKVGDGVFLKAENAGILVFITQVTVSKADANDYIVTFKQFKL